MTCIILQEKEVKQVRRLKLKLQLIVVIKSLQLILRLNRTINLPQKMTKIEKESQAAHLHLTQKIRKIVKMTLFDYPQ